MCGLTALRFCNTFCNSGFCKDRLMHDLEAILLKVKFYKKKITINTKKETDEQIVNIIPIKEPKQRSKHQGT